MPTEKYVDGVAEFVRTFSREFESYLKDLIKKEVQAQLGDDVAGLRAEVLSVIGQNITIDWGRQEWDLKVVVDELFRRFSIERKRLS